MLKNYFKTAVRHLVKQKAYAFINGFGLSVGIAFCLLILTFIQDELSFDRFHTKADRIYRIHRTNLAEPATGEEEKGFFSNLKNRHGNKLIYLPIPLAPLMQEEIPEIKQTVRVREGQAIFRHGDKVFNEKLQYVDKNFFDMFSFPLKQGSSATVLNDLSSLVITSNLARKFFGEQNPIGKTLVMQQKKGEEKIFTITGVCEEAPGNSSLALNILIPFEHEENYQENKNQLYNYYSTLVFAELTEHASINTFRQHLSRFINTHYADEIAQIRGDKKLDASTPIYQLGFTNIADTHFDTSVYWNKVSNPLYTYILSGIALLILLIACINYISLSMTSASSRTQEIGIRKVIGASRKQVAWQLWIETQLLVIAAVICAILLVHVFLPAFNYFTEKQLTFQLLKQPVLMAALLGLTVLVGAIVGGYPALFLSGFHPIKVLKSNRTYRFNPRLSGALVLVQYTLCLFLVTSSMIMYRQMQFITRKDLGYNKEQVLVVSNHNNKNMDVLMERIRQFAAGNPDIVSVSSTSGSFSKNSMAFYFNIQGENLPVDVYMVDQAYIPTLGIQLQEGRNFSSELRSDSNAIIINETLAARLGKDGRVGEMSEALSSRVVGVVKDYHYASLESKIAPMALFYRPNSVGSVLVKIKPGRIPEALSAVENNWKTLSNGQPFEYSFLDEDINSQYKTYQRWMGMMGASTLFAIGIACLGLFGLSGLMAVNRTKEIGIRKVLGATLTHIFFLLNKSTVKIALVAFVLAVPFSWYLMNKWLDDFAYRISISWEIFAVAGLIGILTAIVAVSAPSIKAALMNPVKSLRNE
ncbi:FtsX-like permease family protein [Rhodocytophaga rosea]|uniref:FtsX-like permease family protein n=1 Tax=Rhodocytophaga rosea TaxID=2704465 RepID=A0A6C0GMG6_9BACT|nr:ABC transporter permease [Rhodocytophaga rosea]QHT69215.1 FtsX-like permease family protein [Rhodocytophaga rosea]